VRQNYTDKRDLREQLFEKKNALELECLPEEGQVAEDCSFEWSYSKSTDHISLDFELDFKNFTQVSNGYAMDHLMINFWGVSLLRDEEGNQMFGGPMLFDLQIPRQTKDNLLTRALRKVAEVASIGALTLLISQFTVLKLLTFLIKTVQKAALNEVFGMFTFLQLIVFLPLIDVKFPANSLVIFENLI